MAVFRRAIRIVEFEWSDRALVPGIEKHVELLMKFDRCIAPVHGRAIGGSAVPMAARFRDR